MRPIVFNLANSMYGEQGRGSLEPVKFGATKEEGGSRGQIVDAAFDPLYRKGLYGASKDDITALANLTKGALSHYFRDKNELFYTVCQQALKSYQRDEYDMAASRPTIDRIPECSSSTVIDSITAI